MEMRWAGIYDPYTKYKVGDVVYYEFDGFTYVCIRDNPETLPNEGPFPHFELVSSFRTPDLTFIDGGLF